MKAYGSVDVFLTPALVGGEWSGSSLSRFTPVDWIGGWAGPRAGLDAVEYRKILSPQVFEPRPSTP
jgi:hypothetical protein